MARMCLSRNALDSVLVSRKINPWLPVSSFLPNYRNLATFVPSPLGFLGINIVSGENHTPPSSCRILTADDLSNSPY
jgi:hypothetical protein